MPVLRSTNPAAAQPQPFSLRDVERHAAAILARAQQQASLLLEAAQREAEQLRHAAHAQGMAEGRAEGHKLGVEQGTAAGRQQALVEHKAQLGSLVESLAAAAGEIERSRQQLMQDATNDVVALAVAVARKAVASFAAARPEVVTDTVMSALRLVVGQNDVRIAVNPAQQQTLEQALPALRLRWPALQHVQVVADASVAPGGARVYTRHGEVDATLEGMVDRIAAEITGTHAAGGDLPAR